ncbi:MAG TPA: DUF805 domain-containing protein [Candidatus Acidoferrum sp.]|nr:DUF805 domain-containing protein [Candidatus Acidoferrum sp.]
MSNRIGRLEFLFWCITPILAGSAVLTIVALSLGAVDVNAPTEDPKLRALLAPVVLLVSIAALRAAVARLHDLGWATWVVLLAFIPLVGVVLFLILFLVPGQKVSNVYGDPAMFLERWRKSKQAENP